LAVGYDATDPGSIPASVAPPDYACGYVDGNWPSYAAMAARFPLAVPVSITAIPGSAPSDGAQVCDCEDGDYTPPQAALWAQRRIAQGLIPCIYCSLASWGAAQQACIDLGLNLTYVDWWIAAYPGNGPALYPGSVGHQFVDRGTYDESVFLDGWVPGRPIAAPPVVVVPEEEDMPLYTTRSNGTGFIVASDLSHKQGLPTPQDAVNLLNTSDYKMVALTDALIDAIPG
jgi:hypothetical protein